MYNFHVYGYPLQECRIYNMHWGVPIGLVKCLQHFHYFSSSNTRWLACEGTNFFSKEAFWVWQELCIWEVPVQRSQTKDKMQTCKHNYALDCFLRNLVPLSQRRQLVLISSQYQHSCKEQTSGCMASLWPPSKQRLSEAGQWVKQS